METGEGNTKRYDLHGFVYYWDVYQFNLFLIFYYTENVFMNTKNFKFLFG